MSRFMRRQRLGVIPAEASPSLPRNAVLHGDCIDVMAGFPDASVDFILTDPPYLCRYRDRAGRTVANDDNPAWLLPAFAEAFRVLREDALCVSFYGWHEVDRFMDVWRAAGFRPVAHLVFAKPYASSARFAEARHECAYVLAKGRPPLTASSLEDGKHCWPATTDSVAKLTAAQLQVLREELDGRRVHDARVEACPCPRQSRAEAKRWNIKSASAL